MLQARTRYHSSVTMCSFTIHCTHEALGSSKSAEAEGMLAIADQTFGRFSFNDAAMARAFKDKPEVLERFNKCIRVRRLGPRVRDNDS